MEKERWRFLFISICFSLLFLDVKAFTVHGCWLMCVWCHVYHNVHDSVSCFHSFQSWICKQMTQNDSRWWVWNTAKDESVSSVNHRKKRLIDGCWIINSSQTSFNMPGRPFSLFFWFKMLGNSGLAACASVGKQNWTMGLRYSSMSKERRQHQPWISKPQCTCSRKTLSPRCVKASGENCHDHRAYYMLANMSSLSRGERKSKRGPSVCNGYHCNTLPSVLL